MDTTSRRCLPRRWLGLLGVFVLMVLILWVVSDEHPLAKFRLPMDLPDTSELGLQSGPEQLVKVDRLTQVSDLDPELLPESVHHHGKESKRLVFIGDIHGCKKELLTLLDAVAYKRKTDHIITTGDILNKGPDSSGVIDFLIEEGASCVRGNNEDKVLRLLAEQDTLEQSKITNDSREGEKDVEVRDLALALTSRQLHYIRSFPLILRVGHVTSADPLLVVVHAGLVPGIELKEQDPYSVMNMRIIDAKYNTPSNDDERKGSYPWFEVWNKHQSKKPKRLQSTKESDYEALNSVQTTVVYGHDAKRGLQVHEYTKGLDSSCVRGGQLTALVVSAGGKQNIVQVDCPGYKNKRQIDQGLSQQHAAPPTV